MTTSFKLQFDPAEIPGLVKDYNCSEDVAALEAGRRIANGDCSRANLIAIFVWKTKRRGISRIERNTDKEIGEALSLATHAKEDRIKIATLRGLHGVEIPVASAILTAIDPERYTVIDFRALAALGVSATSPSLNLYISYLRKCRELAFSLHVGLRDLDRALWQWHKNENGGD